MESHGFTQALVAQRIRASDYGSEGREFESLRARLESLRFAGAFLVAGCGAVPSPYPVSDLFRIA